MINRTILVGRITKAPELKYTASNIAFVKFTLAVNRSFTEANGERKADFIQCIVWRNQAENISKFVKKGSLLGVEGRIQTGSYDDKEGNRKYTTDVVCDSVQFLEPKGTQEQDSYQQTEAQKEAEKDIDFTILQDDMNGLHKKKDYETIDIDEDSLPF
jgi:single-strand DNA-binding protein